MHNLLFALSWGFGILTALIAMFIYLRCCAEADDPEFQKRFSRAFENSTQPNIGTRAANAFLEAHDQPLRLRWKLFWSFLLLTALSIGGLYLA